MAKIIGNTTATPNPRPDWNQVDETKADYIKNKPIIDQTYMATSTNAQSGTAVAEGLIFALEEAKKYTDNELATFDRQLEADLTRYVEKVDGKGLSTEDFTTDEKNKLANLSTEATPQIQSDWDQTDSTKADYIKNKPDLSSIGEFAEALESKTQVQIVVWEAED